MRNSGWYIPFWRKPKRAPGESAQGEKPEKERRRRPRTRSEEELERVREDWVNRYTRQVRALKLLGLSVGTPQEEILARYRDLVARVEPSSEASDQLHRLHEAYELLRQPD